ncbi:hypothetical protein HD554DRAFT_2038255 [Boletus coccyginus]|nr:hypothetical protein HD554DRAFT_2038255 [Boletus coccyginus]
MSKRNQRKSHMDQKEKKTQWSLVDTNCLGVRRVVALQGYPPERVVEEEKKKILPSEEELQMGILKAEWTAVTWAVDLNVAVEGILEAVGMELVLIRPERFSRTFWRIQRGVPSAERYCGWYRRWNQHQGQQWRGDFFRGHAKSSSGVNIPIKMDSFPFFLQGSAFLMVVGKLCWRKKWLEEACGKLDEEMSKVDMEEEAENVEVLVLKRSSPSLLVLI